MWEQSAAHLSDVQATRSDRREQAGAWDRVRLNLTEMSIVLLLTWQGLQQGLQPGLHGTATARPRGPRSTLITMLTRHVTAYTTGPNNPH